MGITSSLYTGVSGLNANGQWLSVIGDNVANVNTNGYKGSTIAFGDILSQTLTGLSGSSQVGRGVSVGGVTPQFTQGSFQNTSSALDMAVDGEGFFIVNNNGATSYTRAGNFQMDSAGNVTTPTGAILQGYQADASGNITGAIGNVTLLATQSPALATSSATLSLNLNASDTAIATAWGTWTAGTTTPPPATLYNDTTTLTAYDSLGGAHQVNAYFTKTAANTWTAHYVYTDAAGNYQNAGSQNLTFSNAGALTADNDAAITFAWGGGVANGSITFDYGTSTAEGGSGLDGTTQYSSAFSVTNLSQNGYASGTLKNLLISTDGVITGVFTNGQTRNLAQLALARFTAPTGLVKMGNNLYTASNTSGQPIVGAPTTSGLGRTLSNTLELSNVDIATEFTNLISAQRGFQANTKIITTTDDLLNLLISIKQ